MSWGGGVWKHLLEKIYLILLEFLENILLDFQYFWKWEWISQREVPMDFYEKHFLKNFIDFWKKTFCLTQPVQWDFSPKIKRKTNVQK